MQYMPPPSSMIDMAVLLFPLPGLVFSPLHLAFRYTYTYNPPLVGLLRIVGRMSTVAALNAGKAMKTIRKIRPAIASIRTTSMIVKPWLGELLRLKNCFMYPFNNTYAKNVR